MGSAGGLDTQGSTLYNLFAGNAMRRVRRTKRYHKSLAILPDKDQAMVEAAVDRLEGEWRGLDFAPLQGTKGWWRLSVGPYRVFCLISAEPASPQAAPPMTAVHVQEIVAHEVVRRSTTT
jgi:mRNA-degrading endonuclease RelE of RelBE toxin-antitoxin system